MKRTPFPVLLSDDERAELRAAQPPGGSLGKYIRDAALAVARKPKPAPKPPARGGEEE